MWIGDCKVSRRNMSRLDERDSVRYAYERCLTYAAADGINVRTLLCRNRSKMRCVANERFNV